MDKSKFNRAINYRINKRVPIKYLRDYGITSFYVGGNCLNRMSPNDIDIFPLREEGFGDVSDLGVLVSQTKNATTVRIKEDDNSPIIVQLCNYFHPSLKKLVDSFDFSHIQIGAYVSPYEDDSGFPIYYTEAYENAKALETTEYVGSEYPLASLMRSYKYQERGDFSGKSHIMSTLSIVHDIVSRGVAGYEDFKDQLDAVDLGLLPEDMKELNTDGSNKLEMLFTLLSKEIS